MEKTDLKSLPMDQLEQWVLEHGEKKFRAKQLYQWMHVKLADSVEQMSNLPAKLREQISENSTFTVLKQVTMQESAIDGTRKYLFELEAQVGCRMGCRFCASTLDGLVRNLTPAEMLEQIYRISADTGERVSNVVVMGTGEPLDNYDNLLTFLRMLTDENGLHISQRNITVSTCGLVPRIRDLAKEDLQITLALSLHASSQEKRLELMPVAKAYEIHEVVDALRDYFEETGRRVTFEYSLVAGVNDSEEDAKQLSELIRGINCHVNLIPVNPIKERDFVQPDGKAVQEFKNKLEKCRINVTIRREMGRDIDGACGQLRKRYSERQDS